MKTLFLTTLFTLSLCVCTAQSNGTPVPNSGSDNTVPNFNSNPVQNTPTPATPSNSTVPGANGSYSANPAAPNISNPSGNSSYTMSPNSGTTTITPQSGTYPQTGTGPKKK